MGSAKVSNAKPQTMESRPSRTLSLIKSIFHIDKKKEKGKEKEINRNNEPTKKQTKDTAKPETTVASILEPFKKLELQQDKKPTIQLENKQRNSENADDKDDTDERDNFTFNVIEEDRRSARIYSQSSQDSGFSDTNDVVDTLTKLSINKEHDETKHTRENKIKDTTETKQIQSEADHNETETKEDKKKKFMPVLIRRAPIRGKVSEYSIHPYEKDVENTCKPISQINKQTLSGGALIVNQPTDFIELDTALESVANLYHSDPAYWEDVLDVITNDKDVTSNNPQTTENYTHTEKAIPIEEFSHIPYEDYSTLLNYPNESMFPTPPRSENVPSPLSESQAFYASHSDYTLSPSRSSPIYNSDFEKYQEISPLSYDEEEKELKRDRTSSVSSMTMKNFKDLQKEIANSFSKKECCDINRKPCKKIFEDHMQKLKVMERRNLCLKVSKLDLKTSNGVLHHVLLTLSKECDQEDLHYALFALVCQRVLVQSPAIFAGDFGLSILKAAALRCPHRPLLTRFIVQCVYLVLRNDSKLCANECVFHEVDAQGDNLVVACARGGDAYALVLAEITRNDLRGELPPLFRLQHANSDGYTALHVACRMHSASSPRLHTVHVLLDHANADLWKGDIKGGDTPLHLAVNSSTCCLQLIMILFKHQDRKQWKKLAHAQNMSSVTPLEYARSAKKSTTRQNYPPEVLEFLKKCR